MINGSAFQRVMVCLDGSQEAERVIPVALSLAGDSHPALHMLCIVDAISECFPNPRAYAQLKRASEFESDDYTYYDFNWGQQAFQPDNHESAILEKLDFYLGDLFTRLAPARTHVVAMTSIGSAASQIERWSTILKPDLIGIVTKRSRAGRIQGVSSTTADLLGNTNLPILVGSTNTPARSWPDEARPDALYILVDADTNATSVTRSALSIGLHLRVHVEIVRWIDRSANLAQKASTAPGSEGPGVRRGVIPEIEERVASRLRSVGIDVGVDWIQTPMHLVRRITGTHFSNPLLVLPATGRTWPRSFLRSHPAMRIANASGIPVIRLPE